MEENLHKKLLKCKTKEDKISLLLKTKLSKNLNDSINSEEISFGLKIANKISKISKSWTVLLFFVSITVVWVVFNVLAPTRFQFDQFPFSLSNWATGIFVFIQSAFLLISQSQSEKKDKERDDLEFQLDYKAEMLAEESYKMIKEIYDEVKNKKGD